MNLQEILDSFSLLDLPDDSLEGNSVYSVMPIDNTPSMIGKDALGRPSILLKFGSNNSEFHTPISLSNLRVQHGCQVHIVKDGEGKLERTVSLIECLSEKPGLQELFIRSFHNFFCTTGSLPNYEDIADLVDHLVELFRAASELNSGEVLGLWSELFVIANCASPKLLVQAWHPKVNSSVDFATNHERVDIKSTTTGFRRHLITFDQANPPTDVNGYIVSILTEETEFGVSVFELWQKSLVAVTGEPDLRMKIDRLCIQTLGKNWSNAAEMRFDHVKAKRSLSLYSVGAIPRISACPPGVGRIQFESDMARSIGENTDSNHVLHNGIAFSILSGTT